MTEREDALKELGRILTERREQAGMTLDDVYDRTKIRLEYLSGIEAGDYTNFPEVVYVKGFIRTYLKLINAEDLKDEFMARLDQSNARTTKKHEPAPVVTSTPANLTEGFKPASHFWLFVALIAALVGTGIYVWYAFSYGGLDLSKMFNFNKPAVEPEPIIAEVEEPPVVEEPAPVSEDKQVAQEEPKPEIKPSFEIRAVNDVWVQISFADGTPTFTGTIKRGNSRAWNISAPVRALIGRPSATQVILNGKDLGIVNPRAKKGETYIYNPDGTYQLRTQ